MEPATLYILFALADGTQKAIERRFPSASDCDGYVEHVVKPRSQHAKIVRFECVLEASMAKAPEWFPRPEPERLIHGVPLELKHQP
jgi:hypothetical protein